ncbi:Gfo/Idh/MocA family oxidoreductase [Ruficoccus amylovorans]|uniref:Gfo/Idh/MocA family oxidoreductase n=1 Tax=Ruficoccus amylovorans TaxID=1804625 RepID=A0A842HCN0_9BACT|nr:Gfo/Idh/MocA family oxidoreductase [Ruficoccus amylovorans]
MNTPHQPPIRVGIIGVSGYAGLLADCVQRHVDAGHAHWIAAAGLKTPADIARCEILARQGAHIHTDWRELIDQHAGQLDLLMIPTAIHVHREMTEYALARGLRVFMEKPLAATYADARAICEANRLSQGELVIGYQNLYCESTHQIKRYILEGRLGKIQSMRALALWPRPASYYSRNGWAGRLSTGGKPVNDSPVNNALAHHINLLLFWAGSRPLETAHVEAIEGSLYRARDIESFDTASLRISTGQDYPLEFHGSHSTREIFNPELHILGSRGNVRWKTDQSIHIETPTGREVLSLPPAPELRDYTVSQLMRWAAGEKILCCTPGQALEQTHVVDLIHRHLPIRRIPDRFIDMDEGQPVVEGLPQAFQRRYLEGGCLRAGDTPWAESPALALPAEKKSASLADVAQG